MPQIPLRYNVGVLVYCLSCVALHNLLHKHYLDSCNTWLAALSGISPSAYCGIVRKVLGILQTTPLLVASAVVTGAPLLVE
jgi:hypothetical protein